MEPNLKLKVLRSISKVFEESRESKLADNLFDKLSEEISKNILFYGIDIELHELVHN